ncbi:adhesion G protein-coupled receptor L3-like [Orbicella faveolata]|uniref:adhesion G protein-coupled receptor L3-like n=1 Tax=Orbicella faveolata TaxID=48498 RepID=UPI0009E5E043|nr:adhesion G protein-coupled receptor L3-like [Orbicella faveolata]
MNFGSIYMIFLQCAFSSAAKDLYNKTFCVGKSSGLHADPEDCRAYYDCNNDKTRHRTGLSTGLMFDPKKKTFVHSWKMNCAVKKVYRELWTNVPGSSVTDLESSSLYPCAPSKTKFIDTFCVYNPDSGDYYGQRLRSFFRAPETGNYTFQTSCDNACQLWMSNSELPTGKRLIVDQRKYNTRHLWDKSDDQSSEKIYLEEDNVYYMEVLHKEDILYDFMCVGAKFPTKKKQQPISSKHFVMEGTELDLIGCRGSEQGLQDVKCQAERCKTPDEMLKTFKQSMDTMTKSLKSIPSDQSPASLQQITQVTKESTKTINDVLVEKTKEQWRRSNTSLAMEIAEITESFGKELADKWSNETSAVGSSEDNIFLQASVLSGDYRFPVSNMDKNWKEINDFLTLKVAEIKLKDKTKAFSVIYKSLHEMLPSSPSKVGKEKGNETNYELNSRIIGSLVTPSATGKNLDVRVTLQHLKFKSNATQVPMCVWWDFTAGGVNSTGLWSTKGCDVDTAASNETHSVCKCDHLTNFAVLMQIKSDSDLEVDESHAVALEIITYVGCGLSLIGVTLTVVIIICLSGVRSERNLIHVNLSLSIGIFQIIFLAGIEATSNEVACTLVAVLLHYFLLVSFAWMLIEGVHLYVMVVTVFENSKEQLRIYGLCAYGLPGIVVLIAASVAHDGYGTDSRYEVKLLFEATWLDITLFLDQLGFISIDQYFKLFLITFFLLKI